MTSLAADNCCRTSFAACIFELASAEREIHLLPAGEFRTSDGSGRPLEVRSWVMNADIAARVIAAASARSNPFVIDYEHQTLKAEANGQPAPAAGWFKRLEWREGQGLFSTDVGWTEKAKAMIAGREYKFFSPVFKYDKKTGAVTEIIMGALTNYTGIDGIAVITAHTAARFPTQLEQNAKEDEISAEELAICHSMGLAQSEYLKSRTALRKQDSDDHNGKDDLTVEQMSVCRSMGIPPREYKKNLTPRS